MTLADQFGVAQSSMKALASGSEAMWAAAILLWARIRARMASMALTELLGGLISRGHERRWLRCPQGTSKPSRPSDALSAQLAPLGWRPSRGLELRFWQRTGRQKNFLGRRTMCLSPEGYEMYSLLAGNLNEEKL